MTGLSFSIAFALLGMAIVFSVLLLFTAVITLFSASMKIRNARKHEEAADKKAEAREGDELPGEAVAAVAVSYYLRLLGGREPGYIRLLDEGGEERRSWRTSTLRG